MQKTKTTKNKSTTTKNDCGGIMGKSKQVAICFSAVQFVGQDKPWTGVAGAFGQQQHMFVKVSKTGKACITFRIFFLVHLFGYK